MSSAQASASPWQPRAAAALLAWPAGGPQRLAQRLQDAWQAWARDWGLGGACDSTVTCRATAADSAPGGAWVALGCGPCGTAWICAAADEEAQLAQALFAAPGADTPVVRDVLAACRADRHARLASTLQLAAGTGDCAPPAADLWKPWSGALLAGLPLGARLLLDAVLVRALLPAGAGPVQPHGARAPLTAVHRAAAALALPLQVRLDACEVDIGSLQDLQPGDVVRLPHRLDAPAAVVGPDGQTLFGGYLVRRRGRKAVELAPVGAAPITRVAGEAP